MAIAEDDQSLSRAQRRALRRVYNGRTEPIVIEGGAFLTFREANRYLQTLATQARDAACAAMLAQAKIAQR